MSETPFELVTVAYRATGVEGDAAEEVGWRVVRVYNEGLGAYDDEVVITGVSKRTADAVVAELHHALRDGWAMRGAAVDHQLGAIPEDVPLADVQPLDPPMNIVEDWA